MKATITKPDGTKIEAEGAVEEIMKLLSPQFVYVPYSPVCTCWTVTPCKLHVWSGTGTYTYPTGGVRLDTGGVVYK